MIWLQFSVSCDRDCDLKLFLVLRFENWLPGGVAPASFGGVGAVSRTFPPGLYWIGST